MTQPDSERCPDCGHRVPANSFPPHACSATRPAATDAPQADGALWRELLEEALYALNIEHDYAKAKRYIEAALRAKGE